MESARNVRYGLQGRVKERLLWTVGFSQQQEDEEENSGRMAM
jgi:hypothetical protein